MPASEVDPLLPKNPPAPEISEYGVGAKEGYDIGVEARDQNKQSSEVSGYPHDSPYQTINMRDVEESRDLRGGDDEIEEAAVPRAMQLASEYLFPALFFVLFAAGLWLMTSPTSTHGPDFPPWNPKTPDAKDPSSISDRVNTILDGTPLIDGHNDLAIFLRGYYANKLHTKEFKDKFEKGGMEANVDLPRLRDGKVGGAFWSAFVVCPENASTDFSDEEYATAVSHTLSQIDLVKRLQDQYPGVFSPATSTLGKALENFHGIGNLVSPISIEGLHQIPQSSPLSTLRLYYALGVRAATLTWNCHNAFADAALIFGGGTSKVAPYHRGGLTKAGREVIHEMNRLGMLVDLSHTSYWTQKAALSNGTSAAPVIFSHSSAFALCPHPRNVKDDVLELVKETDSLVMVNFSPDFISCLPPPDELTLPKFYEKNNTLHQVARHIVYIGEKIGYDHVGLGSDYDGMGELTPRGLEGVDKYPDLVAELLKMGVSDGDAAKVVGGNLIRVWMKADEIAEKLKAKEHEGEDEVSGWYKQLLAEA